MKTGRAHYLRTRTKTSVFIKAPGSQLSFSFPAGVTISVVAEDQPEIGGDFKSADNAEREDAGLSLLEALLVLAILMTLGAVFIPAILDALHSIEEVLALVNQVVPMK